MPEPIRPDDPRVSKAIERIASMFMEVTVKGVRMAHVDGVFGIGPQIVFQAHAAALAQELLSIPLSERQGMVAAFFENFMVDVLAYYNAGVVVEGARQ